MSSETTHVIFDLDGTLVNVVDVVIDLLKEYAKSHGKELSTDLETKVANLTNTTEYFNEYLDSIGIEEDEDSRKERIKRMILKIFTMKFKLVAGVEKFVKHLHKHNIPMAVATGNTNRHFGVVSRQFKDFFETYFDHIVCGWDDPEVIKKKPHPDVYHVCADRFQTKSKDLKNILIVEDSLTGITGAVASGMKTLLINDRKLCQFESIADKITLISDSFEVLRPESIGLPAYDS